MTDLFSLTEKKANDYTADDIEVLEGLEPVRRRPGMYIGGTDENALHHLVNEVLDNSMDEAVAGHASRIDITLNSDYSITIKDNGRGIPIDPHPKYPNKSALEVIMTHLHSGGKFSGKAYQTSGGLHGVGVSVVNALSEQLIVEVIKNKKLYRQEFSKGDMVSALEEVGNAPNKRGTIITFSPDKTIFGNHKFKAERIYNLAKSKAYLFRGVEIRWSCEESLIKNGAIPVSDIIHFPKGLEDYISHQIRDKNVVSPALFAGEKEVDAESTKIEWAVSWTENEGLIKSYCNTIPTPLGGTHEQGFRAALLKSLRIFGDMSGNKKAQKISADDVLDGAYIALSVFIKEPLFQGQTKEKLVSSEVNKIVENAIKDLFDHWLIQNKSEAEKILDSIIEKAEDRLSKKAARSVARKNIVQKLRLPGKLADCTKEAAKGTELFLVEGDSAGGSAKQARNRETQAVLPLRGKVLNVASNSAEKINANQEINDLEVALACGVLKNYSEDNLRYEKIIIMTDADVDGAHIASLLMTYFIIMMPEMVKNGHLYLAKPPLYKIKQGANSYYIQDDKEKDKMVKKLAQKSKAKIELSRFKGLGEMTAPQLKETTMSVETRKLIKVTIPEDMTDTSKVVEDLMGRKPEKRFRFIQEQALFNIEHIKEQLDI